MSTSSLLAPMPTTDGNKLTLTGLALIWGSLLIFMGLYFRTYDVSMDTIAMEFSRQIGVPIMVVEIGIVAFAVANGLGRAGYWQQLLPITRALVVIFLSTFWVSSVFVSVAPSFSLLLNAGVVLQVLFAVAVYHCLPSVDYAGLSRVRIIFVATLVVFSAMIFYKFAIATPPHEMKIWQFAIPGFISIRLFGAVCGALLAFFLLMTLIDEEEDGAKSWHYIAITFVLGLTIWTGTRAAVLGVICALAMAIGFYRLRPRRVVIAKLCASLALAVAIVWIIPPPDATLMIYTSGDYGSLNTASAGRMEIWAATWRAFLTVPIFGGGPGANSWMLPPDIFPHVQPHNVVLQFLINWGISGALPAFALLGIVTWRAHRIVLNNRSLLPVLAMLDCLLAMSMVDGILHFARETMMVMMCFAIILRAGRVDQPAPHVQ